VSNQPPPAFCLEFGELLKVYLIPFGVSQLYPSLVTATQHRFPVSTNLKTHRPAAEDVLVRPSNLKGYWI
jgi:hypothetical protein